MGNTQSNAEEVPANGVQISAVWKDPEVLYGVERDGSDEMDEAFCRWHNHYLVLLVFCESEAEIKQYLKLKADAVEKELRRQGEEAGI